MNRHTELALVRALKRGEEAAFDAIYKAHRAKVYSFLLRLGRDKNVAEELLEETWLRLVSRAHTLADDSRILAWLFTVARNLFLSYCRARRMDAARVQELTHFESRRSCDKSPFDATAGNELERKIEAALDQLPFDQREALLLVAIEGFTPSEAAQVCDVRPEAMRQRLSRARATMASKLELAGVDLFTKKEGSRRHV